MLIHGLGMEDEVIIIEVEPEKLDIVDEPGKYARFKSFLSQTQKAIELSSSLFCY